MANADQLALLKRSVPEWNSWRKANPKITPDLLEADLRESDLSNAYLVKANLNKANLGSANLSNANLRKADLIDANLINANLSNANLRNANLENADLYNANLSNANLHKAYLGNANLSNANLHFTSLRSSSLHFANLSNANLSNAKLDFANLFGANLGHANLGDAHLSNANLRDVNFRNTDLRNTQFLNTRCANTVFIDVDLSKAIGLETVRHLGRIHIDVHTVYKSQGNIPDVFLRGGDLPEDFIKKVIPIVQNIPAEFHSCFISYSREDVKFANHLHAALEKHGVDCWKDDTNLRTGEKILDEVANAIHNRDYFILCSSKDALNRWWVNSELDILFAKERQINEKTGKVVNLLITCDLDGYLFGDEYQNGKKARIESGLAADFQGWEVDDEFFEAQIERILKALRTDGGKQPPPKSQL